MENRKKIIIFIALLSLLVIGAIIFLVVRNSIDWAYFDFERNMDSIVHVEVSSLNEDDVVFVVDTNQPLHILPSTTLRKFL